MKGYKNMEKERENRPYFDENKNYLDDEPKPLFDRKKVIEEKVVIKRIRKEFLSYKEAEIVYSLQHKKLLEMADDCGALFRDGNVVRINRNIFDNYLENFHVPAGQYKTGGRYEKKALKERQE